MNCGTSVDGIHVYSFCNNNNDDDDDDDDYDDDDDNNKSGPLRLALTTCGPVYFLAFLGWIFE